ncbi:MAG: hypothetical protein AAGE76_12535 [Pseudomonadota bacterium]
MLQDKNEDLDAARTKKLLERLVSEVSRSGFDLYYASTSEIATYLLQYAKTDAQLNQDERALLKGLSRRDVEVILSIKD